MKSKTILFEVVFLTGVLILSSCSSLSIRKTSSTPDWVENHPVSRTHFVGVGSAKIENELFTAQKQARNRALQNIAEQIQVAIVSDVQMYSRTRAINNLTTADSDIQEKIAAFSKAVLGGWEEIRTYKSDNGYYWSKVVLNKKRYETQVKRKKRDASDKICDIIMHAQKGSAFFQISELYKALTIADEFFGTTLRGRVNGKDVVLSNELHRQLKYVLESISIKTTIPELTLQSSERAPLLGAYVYFKGEVDTSLSVSWSASHQSVRVNGVSRKHDGMYPLKIGTLPPSAGHVTITATLNLQPFTYDLIRRKFSLPSAELTVRRQKVSVYIENREKFARSLAQTLTQRSMITLASDKFSAEYILSSGLRKKDAVILKNSIYHADADLAIHLLAANGSTVLD